MIVVLGVIVIVGTRVLLNVVNIPSWGVHEQSGQIIVNEYIHTGLFLRARSSGLNNAHRTILITSSDDDGFPADSTKEYVYREQSPIFYKLDGRSFIIYAHKASAVPQHFDTKLDIVQVEINDEEIHRLCDHAQYKKEGLTAVSFLKKCCL